MSVEVFFSVAEIAGQLGVCSDYVRRRVKAGEFGRYVVLPGGGLRVPGSGLQSFLDPCWVEAQTARRVRALPEPRIECRGVPARSSGELVRKLS